MAVEDATRFLHALETLESLQQKVASAVEGTEDRLTAIAQVARSEGYDVSDQDLEAVVERTSRELTDEELGHVAGGTAPFMPGGAVLSAALCKLG